MRFGLFLCALVACAACQPSKNDDSPGTTPAPPDSTDPAPPDATGLTAGADTVDTATADRISAPFATDDAALIGEGGETSVAVTVNDTDPDGDLDADAIVLVDLPLSGTAMILAGGLVRYRHDGSEVATDIFTYTVADELNQVSNVAIVTVTVTAVNDPPLGVDDVVPLDEGDTVQIDVTANDVDDDDGIDPASVVLGAPPLVGSVVLNADGTVDYTHDGGEDTADAFSYTVADLSGARSTETWVDLVIAPIDDPPVAGDDSPYALTGAATVLAILANDFDPEGALDLGSVVITVPPTSGALVVDVDGTVTYTFDGSPTAVDAFTYTVSDLGGLVSKPAVVDLAIVDVLPVVTVDLTPPTGTLVQLAAPLWANKGYQFTAGATFDIVGGAWWIDVPADGIVRLSVYDIAGQLLAQGTTATGQGIEAWHQSDLDFTFTGGVTYTVSFYTNRAGSATFDRKDLPLYPFDVDANLTALTSVSTSIISGDGAPEEYPSYLGNSWAPFQRLDVLQ